MARLRMLNAGKTGVQSVSDTLIRCVCLICSSPEKLHSVCLRVIIAKLAGLMCLNAHCRFKSRYLSTRIFYLGCTAPDVGIGTRSQGKTLCVKSVGYFSASVLDFNLDLFVLEMCMHFNANDIILQNVRST